MGIDNTKIFNEIFEQRLLGEASKELASAIILGSKCSSVEVEELRKTTDAIVNTMIVYYGQHISDMVVADIRKFCPVEIKKYHPHLTIQEVSIGVGMAMRDKFGEIKYQKVSLKLLNELIIKYELSDTRKQLMKVYTSMKNNMVADHKFVSQEEQDRSLYEWALERFEKYKLNGITGVIISIMDYNYLVSKAAIPDYKEFLIEAARVVATPLKNKTTASEVIDKMLQRNIEAEAKRLAVVKLYNQLIEQGMSLEEYIQTTVTA